MGAQDGVEDLVQAIRGARASSSAAFTVSVGGDGPVLPAVKALVRELGLEDVVEFVGWLDDPAVRAFLADIDVMLVPDPPTDFNHLCAMNKVTHAMAAGKPVVYRPLRENMAVTGGAGYLASGESIEDFSTAIVRAIEATEAARHQVGQDLQRHFLANHTWAMHCERYLDAVLDRAPSLRE
jgi:glycosyltransferase involved in cell wall biosynthesis